MQSLTLFQLSHDYREAATKLADLDLDENTISDTLESMSGDLEVKATNIAAFARNLEATAAAIREAEVDMAKRRKAIEKRAERLNAYLLFGMRNAGIQKIETPHFTIAVKTNPTSVVIDEPDLIPVAYLRQPPPPPAAPDKAAIKQAINDGIDVPGAHLAQGFRIDIK